MFLIKGSHQPLNFFCAGKTHNGLFSAMDKIIPTTCLFFFDSADVKLLISGRILGSDETP